MNVWTLRLSCAGRQILYTMLIADALPASSTPFASFRLHALPIAYTEISLGQPLGLDGR